MNEILAGLIGMAIIAVVIIILVWRLPNATGEFLTNVTSFKWGLTGIEVKRSLKTVADERQGGRVNEVQTALKSVPISGRLLWVDDHPERNLSEMDLLRSRGLIVDMAVNNSSAAALVQRRAYNAVISNIGRYENGDPKAGLQLPGILDAALDNKRPTVIFYTSQTADTGIDGTVSTSTPVELFRAITNALKGGH